MVRDIKEYPGNKLCAICCVSILLKQRIVVYICLYHEVATLVCSMSWSGCSKYYPSETEDNERDKITDRPKKLKKNNMRVVV